MNLISAQVEEQLEHRLKEAGLSKFVHRERSQFLNLEGGFFVELVLTDATALSDVERIVRHTTEELRANGIQLESVIRALWEVIDVQYAGPSRSPEGGLRAALEFRATLKSGSRDCQVAVDVSITALDVVRQKLGLEDFVAKVGWSPQDGDVDEQTIAQTVYNFLSHLLSYGGYKSLGSFACPASKPVPVTNVFFARI